jgi:hypothetical protein
MWSAHSDDKFGLQKNGTIDNILSSSKTKTFHDLIQIIIRSEYLQKIHLIHPFLELRAKTRPALLNKKASTKTAVYNTICETATTPTQAGNTARTNSSVIR